MCGHIWGEMGLEDRAEAGGSASNAASVQRSPFPYVMHCLEDV